MKTTVITLKGNLNLQPLENDDYKLTGHAIATHILVGNENVLARLAQDTGEGDPYLELLAKDGATINLTLDTRHDQDGWRGTRYVDIGKPSKMWDEWYMFFPTLREAIVLFGKPTEQTKEGMAEARRRF